MIDYEIEPTFTTARGHLSEWFDHALQQEAWWRYGDAFTSHGGVVVGDSQRRRLSDDDLKALALQRRTVYVVVAMPNLAREVERWNGSLPGVVDRLQIVNPVEHLQCLIDGDRIVEAYSQPNRHPDRNPFSGFFYGIPLTPANALLQPRLLLHGWKRTADPRAIDHVGMPAWEVSMKRVVPFSNWRMCGHHFNPNIFDNAEVAEFVIHREQGVILEWRALLDGTVFEHYWFTPIEFDVPIDPALFDRSGIPTGVPIESEPELPWGTATIGKLDQDGTG